MPIYLIKRTDDVHYDQTAGVVVIAETEAQAIALAKTNSDNGVAFSEDPAVWDSATVTELNPDGEPGLVIADFRAG